MRAVFIVLLLAAPVIAEPVQIAEIYGRFEPLFHSSDPPQIVPFFVEEWQVPTTVNDLGRTFSAPPDVVATLDFLWKGGGLEHGILINGSSFGTSFRPDWLGIFRGYETTNASGRSFVPQLGTGLTGYRLTSVEQTIECWFAVPSTAQPSEFAHRIRIFGEPIPEPTSVSLVVGALLTRLLRPLT